MITLEGLEQLIPAEQKQTDTSFLWATVTSVSPFRVRLDGETESLPAAPDSLIRPETTTIGSRVYVIFSGRSIVVLGSAGGNVVDPRAIGHRTFRGFKSAMNAMHTNGTAWVNDTWTVSDTGSKYVYTGTSWSLVSGYGYFGLNSLAVPSSAWTVLSGASTWTKIGGEFNFVGSGAATALGVTVPVAGNYRLSGSVGVAVNGNWFLGVKRDNSAANSGGLVAGNGTSVDTGTTFISFSVVVSAAAGARYIPVLWNTRAAGPFGLTPSATFFSVEKLE